MTFAEKVYDAVSRIPKGRVATYGQIAEIIGCPGGCRAVGNALHINPFAPIDSPDLSTAPAGTATPDGPTALAAAPAGSAALAAAPAGSAALAAAPDGPTALAAAPDGSAALAAAPAGSAALAVAPARRVVPCHRVVAADGSLAAHFGGGGPAVQYSRLAPEGVIFLPTRPHQSAAPTPILAPAASTSASAAQALLPAPAAPALTFQDSSGTGPQAPTTPIPRVDLARCGIVIERHPLEPFLPKDARIFFLGSFPPPCARWSMDFFYPNWINDFWRIQGMIHFGDPHYFEYKSEISSPVTPEPACPEPAFPEPAAMLAGPAPAAPTAATAADAAAPNAPTATAAANPAVHRTTPKRFDRARIIEFCTSHGLAFYDTASKVCRWKGNASDEFLEILEPADIVGMLAQMPDCQTIVSTGGKSAEELAGILVASGATLSSGSSASPSSASGTVLSSGSSASSSSASGAVLSSGSSRVATAITPPPIGSYLDLLLAGRPLRWWRMPSTSRAYPMPLAAKAAIYAQLFR